MITGNTHFALATHVLTALAYNAGEAVTSSRLAESVDTNPAFLRAVIGRLRDAGLLETRLGAGGGSILVRPPAEVSLLEIYRATDGQAKLRTHDCSDVDCAVARCVPKVLDRLESRLDDLLSQELASITLADLVAEVDES